MSTLCLKCIASVYHSTAERSKAVVVLQCIMAKLDDFVTELELGRTL